MFLHSGAGLHGHEYTTKRRSSELSHKRQNLLRSSMRQSFSQDISRVSTPTASIKTPNNHNRDVPAAPNSRQTPLPSSAGSVSECTRHKDHSVRFHDEPRVNRFSISLEGEDDESVAGSEITAASDVNNRRRHKQRLPRKSTTFALAHAVPGHRTKQRCFVQFRPKVLLQLQELGEKRAVPAFDVVPSYQIVGSFIIPFLAKQFPRIFCAKPELGQNDLLLMRNEDYSLTTSTIQKPNIAVNDKIGHRDVFAVISIIPPDGANRAELAFIDGSTWSIETISNGSFEMTKTDGDSSPVIGRWVRRSVTPRTNSIDAAGTGNLLQMQYKWTFSFLDPAARRHPIMGVLTSTTLEIYDNYNTESTSGSQYPPITKSVENTISLTQIENQSASGATVAEKRKTVAVPDEARMLMMASATWINLAQAGWPATANPKLARTYCQNRYSNEYPRRSLSMQTDSREISDELKLADGTSHQRGKSTSFGSTIEPPARRLSAASSFMKKQQEQRQRQQGTPRAGEPPDTLIKPASRSRGPMTRLTHWLNK